MNSSEWEFLDLGKRYSTDENFKGLSTMQKRRMIKAFDLATVMNDEKKADAYKEMS
jgi:hypothetical protein